MDEHADLEALVLGAAPELTRDEVSALAGVPEPEARAMWVALGFPAVEADVRAFTRLDAEALSTCVALRDSGVVDDGTLLVLARAMGQGLSRLAEAQIDAFRGQAAQLAPDDVLAATRDTAGVLVPQLERLLVHVWRRQLAAATVRSLAAVGTEGLPVRAVGFVDLVGYTRTSRSLSAAELEHVLEQFERETARRVTEHGGRVVKTLGDEVMFTCDDAPSAALVALETVEAHDADEALPDVRAGVALGGVVLRLGDVFGEPVNLASRLTSEARPGTVLGDLELSAALEQDDRFALRRLPSRQVRGYSSLRPHVVRRASVRP